MKSEKSSKQDAPAVARAHAEAWSNHNWDKAREMLASNVHVRAISPQPTMAAAATDLTGKDDYMEGLIKFAQAVEPGSLHVINSVGDERNSLILFTVRADFGQGKVTLASSRLALLDENNKIKAEDVIFSVLSD